MSLTDAIQEAINKSDAPKVKEVVQEASATKVEELEENEIQKENADSKEEPSEDEVSEEEAIEAVSLKKEKEPKKEAPRIEKIIEDGVEREISLDELKKGYQKASVSGKRFEEASKIQKENIDIKRELQDFVDLAQQNPIVAMYDLLGRETMDHALNTYRKEMADFETMTEAERENFILKRQLDTRNLKRNFEDNKRTEILTDEQAQYLKEDLSKKVEKVVSGHGLSTTGLKVSLLNKMKSYSKNRPQNSPMDLSEIEFIADQVKSEFKSDMISSFKSMTLDEKIEAIGEETLEDIRKMFVDKFKTQKAKKITTSKSAEPERKTKSDKSIQDYQKFFNDPGSF